ncbi:MAG: plasmid pRiA4b ORF-3 family protein [Planctomycetota bacterium]
MPTKPPAAQLILHIELADLVPPIWRRVEVPSNLTLAALHAVIQSVMPWGNCHMYRFESKDVMYVDEREGGGPSIKRTSVSDVLKRVGARMRYVYDYGDEWVHEIRLEARATDSTPRLLCLEGARRAPPEDSGGPWGYIDKLEILQDPDHEEYEDVVEWMVGWPDEGPPPQYDAETFDIGDANARLARLGERLRLG